MKKFFLIAGIIIGIIVIAGVGTFFWMNASTPSYVVKKLQDDSIQASIILQENGKRTIEINPNDMMALASTFKTIVALEYAFQVEEGILDPEEPITLTELHKLYLPNLDGGAHEGWLAFLEEKGLIEEDTVHLREVVRGMIWFSSNANTEFMMEKLGVTNIEKRIKEIIGVEDHSPIFYYSSFLLAPYEIQQQEFPSLTIKEAKDDIIATIHSMSDEEIFQLSETIHQKLLTEPDYLEKVNFTDWWNTDFDKLFSETFIQSTTNEYVSLMEKINRKVFPETVQKELELALEAIMMIPQFKEHFLRAGEKGGSSLYIMTDALFAEDKEGNLYELAVFFNDLNPIQAIKIQNSLREFEYKLLSDSEYREEVIELLE